MSTRHVILATAVGIGGLGYAPSAEAAPMPSNATEANTCVYLPPAGTGEWNLQQKYHLTADAVAKEMGVKAAKLFTYPRLDVCIGNGVHDERITTPNTPASTVENGGYHTTSEIQAKTNELLVAYGMPKIPVDGQYGEMTKRAVCAAEWLIGLPNPSRDKISPSGSIASSILAAGGVDVPPASKGRSGKWADVTKTCQVAAFGHDGSLDMVFPVSTGKLPSLDTPAGNFKAVRYDAARLTQAEKANPNNKRRDGWHDSIDSPSPSGRGNMYKPVYTDASNGGVAFHGADNVPTYPASHRCIRTRPADQDKLVLWLGLGDKASATRKDFAMSVVIEGAYKA